MDEDTFVTYDDQGNEVVCDILFTFDWEDTGKSYIIYTDNTKDKDGNINVYASTYDAFPGRLDAVESEQEWNLIERIFDLLREEVAAGNQDIDSIAEKVNRMLS